MKMKKLIAHPVYYPGKDTLRPRQRTFLLICLICGALLFSITLSAASDKAAPKAQSGQDLGEVGAKLANPLAEPPAESSAGMIEYETSMEGDFRDEGKT